MPPLQTESPVIDSFRSTATCIFQTTLLPQPGESGYDRLGKVRPVMEKLQKRFLEMYHPHCENAIALANPDEIRALLGVLTYLWEV